MKTNILEKLVNSLKKIHRAESMPADTFSLKEAYFNKTFNRLSQIQDLVPFAREKKSWSMEEPAEMFIFIKENWKKF